MSDSVTVWWEGRGTPNAIQQLNNIIATHQNDIETTTKGPIRSKSTKTPGNIVIEEEQKVTIYYIYTISLCYFTVTGADQRLGGSFAVHVDYKRGGCYCGTTLLSIYQPEPVVLLQSSVWSVQSHCSPREPSRATQANLHSAASRGTCCVYCVTVCAAV